MIRVCVWWKAVECVDGPMTEVRWLTDQSKWVGLAVTVFLAERGDFHGSLEEAVETAAALLTVVQGCVCGQQTAGCLNNIDASYPRHLLMLQNSFPHLHSSWILPPFWITFAQKAIRSNNLVSPKWNVNFFGLIYVNVALKIKYQYSKVLYR